MKICRLKDWKVTYLLHVPVDRKLHLKFVEHKVVT